MSKLKKNAKNENEERIYSISASPYILDQLEEILKTIETLGSIGASRELNIFVDGDGSARIKIKRQDKDIKLNEKEINTDNDIIDNLGLC